MVSQANIMSTFWFFALYNNEKKKALSKKSEKTYQIT